MLLKPKIHFKDFKKVADFPYVRGHSMLEQEGGLTNYTKRCLIKIKDHRSSSK